MAYYPAMPGNSTTRPFEKLQQQQRCMNPAQRKRLFHSQPVTCRMQTLSWALQRFSVPTLHLLKVGRNTGRSSSAKKKKKKKKNLPD